MNDVSVLSRDLADRLSDGIFVASESGLAYVNPCGLMLLGTDRSDEVIGKPLSSFLRPVTFPEMLRQTEHQPHGTHVATISGNLLRLDGGTVEVCLSSLPILWEGVPSCLLVIAQGASPSKVADRTLAAAYRHESSKMETIGMLAAGIAHEMNNSLTAVLGFSQLALMLISPDSKAHRHIQHVIAAGRRSSELIHQALMFSRQNDEARHPLSLHVLVSESLKLLRSTIPSWIELRERIATTTSPIKADSVQVRQILVNLVADAVHAMRCAGGVLDIEVQDEELSDDRTTPYGRITAGRYVCLRVKDSGEVTKQEGDSRFFDPSFTANALAGEQGVGLSVVHGIVSAHRGAVLVESRPGLGTTVEIFFPTLMAHASLVSTEGQALGPRHDLSAPLIEESDAVGPRD